MIALRSARLRPSPRPAFRARLLALFSLAFAMCMGLLFVGPSPSAQAQPTDPAPIVEAVFGPNTEIYTVSIGAGLTIDGFQPPDTTTQDPTAP